MWTPIGLDARLRAALIMRRRGQTEGGWFVSSSGEAVRARSGSERARIDEAAGHSAAARRDFHVATAE